MNIFYKYTPRYIDLNEKPKPIQFETMDQLLTSEALTRWSTENNFSHFAISKSNSRDILTGEIKIHHKLIAVLDNGYYWWVVGKIEGPIVNQFEEWKPKYKIEHITNGEIK